jgi:hypothetical protein
MGHFKPYALNNSKEHHTYSSEWYMNFGYALD